jgi:hypothetical protein
VNLKALGVILLVAALTFTLANAAVTYLFPSIGRISQISLSSKWLDGSDVTIIDWGIIDNDTAYIMDPINITNTGNVPVTLMLSYANPVNITTLTLTWNYSGEIVNPQQWIIVELTQTVIANQLTFSYDTVITPSEAT